MDAAEIDKLIMQRTARRRLGRYLLLGRLAQGGMGKLYLALAPGPDGVEKLVVLKRLHSHLAQNPALVARFVDEARVAVQLHHPHIVQATAVEESEAGTLLILEYVEGQHLGLVLRAAKRSERFPDGVFWSGLFLDVLDALHAAHTALDVRGRPLHVVHRDVSPQNVIISYEGYAKLLDFGIARATVREVATDEAVLKGKYAYMSPEQARGEPLDGRSDVFAAGVVLWEMLAARRLYKTDSAAQSVDRILREPPISPLRANPDCDPGLAVVCLKALQKDRNARFSSAAEMRDALAEALQHLRTFRRREVEERMAELFGAARDAQRDRVRQALAEPESDLHEPTLGNIELDIATPTDGALPLLSPDGKHIPPLPPRFPDTPIPDSLAPARRRPPPPPSGFEGEQTFSASLLGTGRDAVGRAALLGLLVGVLLGVCAGVGAAALYLIGR